MQARKNKVWTTRAMAMTAMLGAVASVLMYLEIPIPGLLPDHLKLGFSELPALVASFALGPVHGVIVCLIKFLVKLPTSGSFIIGDVTKFLLGCTFVLPAGFLYRWKKCRGGALFASLIATAIMALLCIPINLYIAYPVYAELMGIDRVLGMYQAVLPSMDAIWKCILIFNVPLTLLNGLIVTLLTFLIYKPLSRFIKGANV